MIHTDRRFNRPGENIYEEQRATSADPPEALGLRLKKLTEISKVPKRRFAIPPQQTNSHLQLD
jgi:hypothetical protein